MLAHPDRLAIVRLLSDGTPRSVTELAVHARKSVSALSHDLALLRRHGVLRAAKRGHHVWHGLQDPRFAELAQMAAAVTRPAEDPAPRTKDTPKARKTRRDAPKKRLVRARR